MLYELERYPEALEAVKRCLELSPGDTAGKKLLAKIEAALKAKK